MNLFGCAKGAGMIGPQLVPHATMLVYLFTDLAASSEHLTAMLSAAVKNSFDCISIDGDMSTNDTVLLLASGKSGVAAEGEAVAAFEAALQRVCDALAYKIVDDGEGVTHVVTLEISGRGEQRGCVGDCQDDCDVSAVQDGVVERRSQLGTAAGGRRARGRGV